MRAEDVGSSVHTPNYESCVRGRPREEVREMNSAYFLTCALAGFCALVTLRNASGAGWFWLAIAIGLLIILGLRERQIAILVDIDLRHAITRLGWYPRRRPIQIAAIGAIAIAVAAILRLIVLRHKKLDHQTVWALSAFAALVLFAATRSSSLHWTDAVLEFRLGAITVGQLVQGICVAIIAICALSLMAFPVSRRT